MDTTQIIALIDSEISKLQQARALLTGAEVKRGPGRPKGASPIKPIPKPPRKYTMSAEARAKIAAAQKARWAKAKKSTR